MREADGEEKNQASSRGTTAPLIEFPGQMDLRLPSHILLTATKVGYPDNGRAGGEERAWSWMLSSPGSLRLNLAASRDTRLLNNVLNGQCQLLHMLCFLRRAINFGKQDLT